MNEQAGLIGLDEASRQMIVETVQQLRKRLLTKEKILEFDKEEIFPEDVIREIIGPEIGLQLLFIPEEYGGMGGGTRDNCMLTREMAKICLGVATAFFAIHLGADPLLVGGTEAQKEKWLGKIAEGNTLVAYAVTEPGAGSNVASLKTKAEPVMDADGNVKGYTVNGSKQFISTGGYADYITLLANAPEGPTFFVVEKGTEGYVIGKGEEKHGIRASNTSALSFSDVFVPVENLIGGIPGRGLKQANEVFGYTRLMVAAMALGAFDAVFDIVIPYAKERIQFGTPLSEKQGYTHKLIVPHAVRREAAVAYIDEIATRLDAGEKDLQVEGSISKLFSTESANRAADDGIQALGGYGYITEYEIEKIKRDVKITCIYEGTSEIQQNIISTFRWKTSRKTKGGFYREIADEMKEIGIKDSDIGTDLLNLSASALNNTIDKVHENRLTKQQFVMFQLADMMTFVEVGASLCRKAGRLAGQDSAESRKSRLAAKLFAADVSRCITEKGLGIIQGCGLFDPGEVAEYMAEIRYDDLIACNTNLINDMDAMADILFERD